MPPRSTKPSNAVLSAKMDGLQALMEQRFDENSSSHDYMNNHLEKLNGQVEKNTSFRFKTSAYLAIAGVGIPILISILVNKFL